ncbi:MAG: hypothetical protein EOM15_12150 [Spirochaetia bacterium]|nr:hypothetical protein [Spirochaetia bacterium]
MKLVINRRFWIRLAALCVVLIFSVFLFFIGRQHTILVDNKAITINDTEYQALQLVEVQINKQPALELAARDRDKFEATGQKHTVVITYTDRNWEEQVIVRSFKVPLMQDMLLLSIPALVGNPDSEQSLWLEMYELPSYAMTAQPVEEPVVTDELSGLIELL